MIDLGLYSLLLFHSLLCNLYFKQNGWDPCAIEFILYQASIFSIVQKTLKMVRHYRDSSLFVETEFLIWPVIHRETAEWLYKNKKHNFLFFTVIIYIPPCFLLPVSHSCYRLTNTLAVC